jgi:hypothetical protein
MSKAEESDIEPADGGAIPPSTHFQLIAHALVWVFCLGLFVFGVTGIESILRDYNIPLPRAAVFVIWTAHQVVALVLLFLVLIGVDWFVLQSLFRRGEIEVAQTWSTLIFATPLVLVALTLIALSLTFFTIDFRLTG